MFHLIHYSSLHLAGEHNDVLTEFCWYRQQAVHSKSSIQFMCFTITFLKPMDVGIHLQYHLRFGKD